MFDIGGPNFFGDICMYICVYHSRQLLKMLRRDTVIGGVAMTSKNVLPHPLLLLHYNILCAL